MTTSRKTFWLTTVTITFGFDFLIFSRSVNRLSALRDTGRTLGLATNVSVLLIWRILRDGLVDLLATLNLKQFSAVPRRVFGWLFFALFASGIPLILFNFVINGATEILDFDLALIQAINYWLVWCLALSAGTIALVLMGISDELFVFIKSWGISHSHRPCQKVVAIIMHPYSFRSPLMVKLFHCPRFTQPGISYNYWRSWFLDRGLSGTGSGRDCSGSSQIKRKLSSIFSAANRKTFCYEIASNQ